MDFSKLSKVSDDLLSGRKQRAATAQGLIVEDEKSPLDSLETRTRVQDSKAAKVLILDDVQIKKIMSMDRASRRKFLSRISDSERRRIFNRYHQIKDEQEASKLDWVNLNALITNAAFSNNSYNKDLLVEFFKEHPQEEFSKVKELADKFINDEYTSEDNELLMEVKEMFESKDIKTSLGEVVDAIYDSTELTPELVQQITESGKKFQNHIKAGQSSFDELMDEYDAIISKYTVMGLPYEKVEEILNDAANSALNEVYDSARRVLKDSVINKIAESELLDDEGNVVETEETETTPLEDLVSALTAFSQGDSEPLQALSGSSELNAEEETEETEDFSEDFDEESEDLSIEDCARFSRAILQNRKSLQHLADRLKKKTALAASYRVSDCTPTESVAVGTTEYVDIPLTHDEFYASYSMPLVPSLAKEMLPQRYCPCVKSISAKDGFFTINEGTALQQNWVPSNPDDSIQDIVTRVNEAPDAEKAFIVSDNCVLVEDCMTAAARFGHLPFVDNRFYRPNNHADYWTFDEVPECLSGVDGITPGVKVYDPWHIAPDGCTECSIMGVPYKYKL